MLRLFAWYHSSLFLDAVQLSFVKSNNEHLHRESWNVIIISSLEIQKLKYRFLSDFQVVIYLVVPEVPGFVSQLTCVHQFYVSPYESEQLQILTSLDSFQDFQGSEGFEQSFLRPLSERHKFAVFF
jgi:hypothetical protein